MGNAIDLLEKYRLIPVAAIENPQDSLYVAEALLKAGLPLIEITFRTASAPESINLIRTHFPEMGVGAGTVLTMEQAKAAVENGAKCIVAPGTNNEIVDYAVKSGVDVFPGVMTPTEIENAMSKGLKHMKFFPAEAVGGIKVLNAFYGPYRDVKFMPTGGINTENIKEYLKRPNVFACGGSWMVKKTYIEDKAFETITTITKETLDSISNI